METPSIGASALASSLDPTCLTVVQVQPDYPTTQEPKLVENARENQKQSVGTNSVHQAEVVGDVRIDTTEDESGPVVGVFGNQGGDSNVHGQEDDEKDKGRGAGKDGEGGKVDGKDGDNNQDGDGDSEHEDGNEDGDGHREDEDEDGNGDDEGDGEDEGEDGNENDDGDGTASSRKERKSQRTSTALKGKLKVVPKFATSTHQDSITILKRELAVIKEAAQRRWVVILTSFHSLARLTIKLQLSNEDITLSVTRAPKVCRLLKLL